MGKHLQSEKLSATITLSECTDGFWLYDKTRGMNLAMSEKSKDLAFLAALEYYQERLQHVESEYKTLKTKVDNFIEQFLPDEE